MDYLKLFQNHSEYETFVSGGTMLKPNASYCMQENEVHYNKKTWADEYLTITPHGNGNVVINMYSGLTTDILSSISYSKDNGETWITTNNVNGSNVTVTIQAVDGEDILLKGEGTSMAKGGGTVSNKPASGTSFSTNFEFILKGNIMSLLKGDNFKNDSDITESTYTFSYLFSGCTNLVDAENLVLPATTSANYCCYYMFQGCTGLTTAPELPATTLGSRCYYGMFDGCTSLATAPELPATTLADYCYMAMFGGCTSLTTAPELPATALTDWCYANMFKNCTGLTVAPELPATTLVTYCYREMFRGCTGLVTAPELPATTLVSNCYTSMFYGCTSLNYIKAMFTTTPSGTYTNNWVSNVAATGTFVKNAAAEWDVSGASGIPNGWTVQTASA